MSNRKLRLRKILANPSYRESDIMAYALESFAREIDSGLQTNLLMRLIRDHAAIAKRLEKINLELGSSREMLAEAQDIALLGRWDVDTAEGSFTWSKSMCDIFEIDSAIPASAELFLSFVHPDERELADALYREMFTKREPWTTRYRLLLRNGTIKWVHLRFFSRADAKGELTHFYGTIQDITELKKVEDALERYSHQLEDLVEEKMREISSSQMSTIYALIKLSESRDDETGAHIERTASFCRLLARKAALDSPYAGEISESFIDVMYKASPLHDIGKVGIPDSILLKPGKLTEEEFAIMKTHARIGYDTLAQVGSQYSGNSFLKLGMEITLGHHEKWNGSGYPQGLRGESIPLSARIMALADVYDALRSKRVYKEAFSHEKSAGIIREGWGSHFDPVLTDLFLRHQEEFRAMYESIT